MTALEKHDIEQLRIAYNDYILQSGPYAYFATLTFRNKQNESACHQQINYFLYRMNRKLFGRKLDGDYLEGFAFAEQHKRNSDNLHYHFLFKQNSNFYADSKQIFYSHFTECLKRIKCERTDRDAFKIEACDLQPVYAELNLIDYLMKSFNSTADPSFILPISKDGLVEYIKTEYAKEKR